MISNVLRFPANRAAGSAGLRVLLADDDRDTVLTLATILADDGHEVRALGDGAGVPELVRDFDPDVVILDIEMPGRNGYALARELHERQVAGQPLLVAISGVWVKPSERFLAIMVGFDHFFQKPADPKELLAVLADFRAGRRTTGLSERLHSKAGAA
ncbi:MAG TPA: response regulator [Burkholderiales bacterium]|nr:response regulator [Burkholderiales bacterium]